MKIYIKILILLAFILYVCENLKASDNTITSEIQQTSVNNKSMPCPAAPIEDHGIIVGTVLDIYHPANPWYDYGKIRIEEIHEYQHDSRATWDKLKIGDEIQVNFDFGANGQPIDEGFGEYSLPIIKIGNKITTPISGPRGGSMGIEWSIMKYAIITEKKL